MDDHLDSRNPKTDDIEMLGEDGGIQEWCGPHEVLTKLIINHPGSKGLDPSCPPALRQAIESYREEPLPFPRHPLHLKAHNRMVEEFVIPEDRREEILNTLYPFLPVPSLDDVMFDLHEGKHFPVREFRVVWEGTFNMLVSPFYPKTGGSVIDWMPVSRRSSAKFKRRQTKG